jgi:hypothetical protein
MVRVQLFWSSPKKILNKKVPKEEKMKKKIPKRKKG